MPKSEYVVHAVTLSVGSSQTVPGVLQLPRTDLPVPAALLLHGFTSRKEQMADSVGRALLRRGVASLAIDLPMHGLRVGSGGVEGMLRRNPLALVKTWKLAVREAHTGLHYLAGLPTVDPGRIAVAGYSLGAYLAMTVAADEQMVSAVALVAGGDLPEDTPFKSLVRTVADPLRAVRALVGRPLLMMNGRRDDTVRPCQAKALFEAAAEPKELRWYDGGHWPPSTVIDSAADWLAGTLAAVPRSTGP